MAIGAWLELDLLRRRREALGLHAPKPIPARTLLWKGGLIGGGLIAAALMTCLTALFYGSWLDGEKVRLKRASDDYDELELRLGRTERDLKALDAANKSLAEAIAGVRSGSALLTELSTLVPRGLQFTKLQVLADQLTINGLVNQPMGLTVINGFELQLAGSPFFQPSGVRLVKALETSVPTASSPPSSTKGSPSDVPLPVVKQLDFELRATFAADTAKLTRNRLTALGSMGLAKRVQLLRREGLLP